jgi:hypothetical protein
LIQDLTQTLHRLRLARLRDYNINVWKLFQAGQLTLRSQSRWNTDWRSDRNSQTGRNSCPCPSQAWAGKRLLPASLLQRGDCRFAEHARWFEYSSISPDGKKNRHSNGNPICTNWLAFLLGTQLVNNAGNAASADTAVN